MATRRIRTNDRHGEAGLRTPEYNAWRSIRARCLNVNGKDYCRYGGRGIKLSPAWERYEGFLADMGRRPSAAHSIDRIDNNKGYEPGNCRWATVSEQARNRRSNVFVGFECVADAADRTGLKYATVHKRQSKGTDPLAPIKLHRTLDWQGRTWKLTDLARAAGMDPATLRSRIDKLGWTVDRAVTAPRGVISP